MEYKYRHTNKITCPYCGYDNFDEWDMDLNTDDINDVDCPSCEKEFYITIWTPLYYSSVKLRQDAY